MLSNSGFYPKYNRMLINMKIIDCSVFICIILCIATDGVWKEQEVWPTLTLVSGVFNWKFSIIFRQIRDKTRQWLLYQLDHVNLVTSIETANAMLMVVEVWCCECEILLESPAWCSSPAGQYNGATQFIPRLRTDYIILFSSSTNWDQV